MRRHRVTLSESLSQMIRSHVKSGRYKNFSAAVQDAASNFFNGLGCPFAEYGVTAEEVEASYQRVSAAILEARKAGKLKPWKPGLKGLQRRKSALRNRRPLS